MISLFNLIVRRGHVPREEAIRRLFNKVGLVVEPNSDCDNMSGEDDGSCNIEGEDGESEYGGTDDELMECS